MQNFFKKRERTEGKNDNAKRQRTWTDNFDNLQGDPKTIVAWNCNGLTSRLHASDSDASQFKEFIKKHDPDVIFLSEVRLPAANNCVSGKPGPNTTWSRSKIRENDKKTSSDANLVRSFFRNDELINYKVYMSLANTKYAGTAMLLNTTKMRPPKSIRYNLERLDVKANVHDDDGRVIVAKFETFSILHTYSPNNGWSEESFTRRRKWDEKVGLFMKRKREANVKIMWTGDLNVAPNDEDLSHPTYYRKQIRAHKGKGQPRSEIDAENIGQPGCTDAERNRFKSILSEGELVDAYRELLGEEGQPGFTWRGIVSGMHGGKGMRIDHCIVSKNLLSRVVSVKITGYGEMRNGFLGSDHCPLLTVMKDDSYSSEKITGKDTTGKMISKGTNNAETNKSEEAEVVNKD